MRSPGESTSARIKTAKPGATLKRLRGEKGLTLKEVSRLTGYPVSTLSKIENDRISLTYDKLTRISAGLEVDIAHLFGAHEEPVDGDFQGRRSVTRVGEGRTIESSNYMHVYPAAELLNKKLIPIIVDLRARSLAEFGELVRHSGEEYVYVMEGEIEVHTSAYAPVRLKAGDSIYLDSRMGHAYIAAAEGACRVLAVCSGSESQMIEAVGGAAPAKRDPEPSTQKSPRPKRTTRHRTS